MYSGRDGEAAVHLARWAIDAHVGPADPPRPSVPETFGTKTGVFVTLNTFPEEALRGCIGFHEAVFPLADALVRAAIAACHDPRFPPLSPPELDQVVAEVSLLTPPRPVAAAKAREYPDAIVVGRDGLLVRRGAQGGLLLPQVPVTGGWDATEFLSQACLKAGLLPDAWFEPDLEVLTFQAEIFTEVEPRGSIRRHELRALHDGHRG